MIAFIQLIRQSWFPDGRDQQPRTWPMRILVLGSYKKGGIGYLKYWKGCVTDVVYLGQTADTPARMALEIIKQTVKVLRKGQKYDIIFSSAIANILPMACLQTLLHRQKPKIVAIDISTPRVPTALRHFIRFPVRSISRIICFTTAQQDWWLKELHFSKATFVQLGIDYDYVELHRSSSIEDYIFTAGRISRDFKTLIKALVDVPARVVIVSGKDPISGRTGLEGIQLPRSCEVYYEVPFERYLELMAKSKLVVIPLENKGYAAGQKVLLEAMALGKPIVVTKTTGTVDYVDDGKTAIFVRPSDEIDLMEKIRLLWRDRALTKRLGEKAMEAAETRFNIKATAEMIYKIVEQCLLED